MYSKIHTLMAVVGVTPTVDGYGRTVKPSSETWRTVCPCRCDDADDVEIRADNGELFRPTYHIVCEGTADVACGSKVKCMDGNVVRGEGIVRKVKRLNYLQYSEVWV